MVTDAFCGLTTAVFTSSNPPLHPLLFIRFLARDVKKICVWDNPPLRSCANPAMCLLVHRLPKMTSLKKGTLCLSLFQINDLLCTLTHIFYMQSGSRAAFSLPALTLLTICCMNFVQFLEIIGLSFFSCRVQRNIKDSKADTLHHMSSTDKMKKKKKRVHNACQVQRQNHCRTSLLKEVTHTQRPT